MKSNDAIGAGSMASSLSVGLAHDYLIVLRVAERTFASMADLSPSAPIYTLFYDQTGTRGRFEQHRIVTSPLRRLGVDQGSFRRLLPLLPAAMARLPVEEHDVVLSSSSAFAHGVSVGDAVHVCYCHSPFRYAWFERDRAKDEVNALLRPVVGATLAGIRHRDRRISEGVTRYVANSEFCRERIARYWERDSQVVHPPVEIERFSIGQPEDYFLIVCELVRHKRVDFALEAASRAGRHVVVVGDGPDAAALRARYSDRHRFAGRASDSELEGLYSSAAALLVPNVEEFGIAAVEAQAAGRPVVGIDAGGLRETVIPGETGELVAPDDTDAFAEALRETDFSGFDPLRIRANAERFATTAFQERLLKEVQLAIAES